MIKLPPSLMSQSWMGSDFSNHDRAKTDSILDDYDQRVDRHDRGRGWAQGVSPSASLPKPDAPVVWGREEVLVRDAGDAKILLEERFYDQDGSLVELPRPLGTFKCWVGGCCRSGCYDEARRD